ncbi:serine/threonine protein phosphatase [Arthrobacter psychrolactophilus]|uniref:Serine/threonine protein phosphatase n=1 Tax=Arthrobacter psychrolactophilus TaxID=92442 RepID=A0A2V5IM74_9MICC|nr:PP2C family serine/threonine-protein phosphatase [Arthrobacter psychrolactophilus]PYI37221.1 serine/threonine protein phosphatase [Arthrobacter psychrolactophilus]
MAEYPLVLRYAARSHVGLVRAKNDDSAYAGRYLAVVADGMGGHAGGDVASASTVLDLIHLDHNHHDDEAGTHLADEIQSANSLLSELVHVNPKLAGMGTTVTALLLSDERLAYAHIGDSRAYRLRDGVFEQLSTDHTFVQRMIDEGRMTEAEAEVHPHKNVLMRVLGDVDASPELDLKYFDAIPGDRWLLCSDGLNFVRHEMVEEVIRNTKSLASTAETLIDLTLAAGSPDNVTVVVFDIAEDVPDQTATLETVSSADLAVLGESVDASNEADDAGSSSESTPETTDTPDSGDDTVAVVEPEAESLDSYVRADAVRLELAAREHELVGAAVTANAEGKIPHLARQPAIPRAVTVLTHKPKNESDTIVEDTEVSLPRLRRRPWLMVVIGVLTALVLVAGSWAAYAWTQTQYFVGAANGNVAIYQGVSQSLGPISLSHLHSETTVRIESLPTYSQQLVANTVPASTLGDAEQIISDLQLGTGTSLPPCNLLETPKATAPATTGSATASPSASAKPTATTTGTAAPSASSTASPTAHASCIPGDGK